MGWAAIISAVLQLVGPLVAEWLKNWLDDKLKVAAASTAAPVGHTGKDTARLLDEVYAGLWFFQTGKRRFVKELRRNLPVAMMAGGQLSPDEEVAIADAARTA